MFGYVRPVLNQLDQEQKAAYKSVYCGLCHTMGKRHGWLARFTLNYDFTLLALLHYSVGGYTNTTCCRCPAHPFRKPRTCVCGESLEHAADQSIILTWYKLCDDVEDHSFFCGIPARILKCLLAKGYRFAAHQQPQFDAKVRDNLERLRLLENQRSPQLDRVADTFAAILAAAADGKDLQKQRVMEQLLYHLGRWIYLVDAWDDLQGDIKAKRYNPLDARFVGKATEEREYLETTMTHSVRLIHSAANLLDFGAWKPILENIFWSGVPTVQHAVLEGTWKELKKQRRTIHERSL